MFVVFTDALISQSTIIKLPTADTTSSFVVTDNSNNVLLKIFGWGAFRAGTVTGTQWSATNIGRYSIATGYNTTASGEYSIALGFYTIASGEFSTAMGYQGTASALSSTSMGNSTTASGVASTAMGTITTASGDNSTAMGQFTKASGTYSTAMGYQTTASGKASTTMGYYDTASGVFSTAMGFDAKATGDSSTAIGNYVSTASNAGSCIIGDASATTVLNSSTPDQMTMRFAGGYRLYSSGNLSTGVHMNAGVSGWTNFCDRNKKQAFRPVDGEELLRKISTIPITEWSYKGTDPSIRYIGPMAQDFYAAFHLGGTDSLGINSISIDGVNMAAIQALEKRTTELQKATAKIAELEKNTSELQKTVSESIRHQIRS